MGFIVALQTILLATMVHLLPPQVTRVLSSSDSSQVDRDPSDGLMVLQGLQTNLLICFPTYHTLFLTGMLIPILLICLSLLHAYKIRKVPNGFNEARALGFVNYVNIILFVLTPIMIYLILPTTKEVVPFCVLLIGSATTELSVLFLPKVICSYPLDWSIKEYNFKLVTF